MLKAIGILDKVAGKMESSGLQKISSNITIAMSDILKIKKAQYLGVQGYWIRNKRCWENCYRHKRADKKSGHDAWFDCHKEYLESINNDDASWNKYADDNLKSIKISKNILDREQDFFLKSVASRMKEGEGYGESVINTIKAGSSRLDNSVIDVTKKLMSIISDLKSAGFDDNASDIVAANEEVIKDALFGNPKVAGLWDKFKGMFGKNKVDTLNPANNKGNQPLQNQNDLEWGEPGNRTGIMGDKYVGDKNSINKVVDHDLQRENRTWGFNAIKIYLSEPWLADILVKALNGSGKYFIEKGRSNQYKPVTADSKKFGLEDVYDVVVQNPTGIINDLISKNKINIIESPELLRDFTNFGYSVSRIDSNGSKFLLNREIGYDANKQLGQQGYNAAISEIIVKLVNDISNKSGITIDDMIGVLGKVNFSNKEQLVSFLQKCKNTNKAAQKSQQWTSSSPSAVDQKNLQKAISFLNLLIKYGPSRGLSNYYTGLANGALSMLNSPQSQHNPDNTTVQTPKAASSIYDIKKVNSYLNTIKKKGF